MLTYTTPSGTGTIENRWDELSPSQFVATVALTNRFFTGEFDLTEYRIRLLELLTGYKRNPVSSIKYQVSSIKNLASSIKNLVSSIQHPASSIKNQDSINENLYLISEQLTFAIRPKHGPAEILEFFSPELRELLKTRFTWEIYDPALVQQLNMIGGVKTHGHSLLKTTFEINFNLGRNPIPQIHINDTILQGPVFNYDSGDGGGGTDKACLVSTIETTLKAGEYLDANEYFTAYQDTKNEKYLDLMIMSLYSPTDEDYDMSGKISPPSSSKEGSVLAGARARGGSYDIPDFTHSSTKQSILTLFIYIQHTLANDPVFKLLYARGENAQTTTNKIYIGPDEAIAQLVEAGYGTHESILNLDIRTFLNYQVIMLKKAVNEMRAYDKKPGEIAKTLNIPVETVMKL